MEKEGESCLDRPENKSRSVTDAGRERINSKNNCKKEKKRFGHVMRGDGLLTLVEGNHRGQNVGEESAR